MTRRMRHGQRSSVAVLACLALAGAGCDELKQKDIPPLSGPAELGTSVRLDIIPDILIANGLAYAQVNATVRDQNGQLVRNREVVFTISDEAGRTADLGQFIDTISTRDVGTAITVRTSSDGVARAVYQAPFRTDFTTTSSIVIGARPLGTDFNAALYRTARLELRSAEPRLFPQVPGNTPPSCNFVIQSPDGLRAGFTVLFQSTSVDTDGRIVRYEWYFSDGTREQFDDHPDLAHVFQTPGTYVVTHVITDNGGQQSACAVSLPITS